MNQKKLSLWLKAITAIVALCILFLYIFIVPIFGLYMLNMAGAEFEYCLIPWVIFVELTALPILASLVMFFIVAENIGNNHSFSFSNSKLIKYISYLAVVDAVYFLMGNVVFLLLNMSHPGIALFALPIVLLGFALSGVSASLSHLVDKAAAMQEETDLTI